MSNSAPSTVDSTWLWNQLNTAVSDQFMPGVDGGQQQQGIQYSGATLVSGNGDGGEGGMIIYQLTSDGTLDPNSGGLISSKWGNARGGRGPLC